MVGFVVEVVEYSCSMFFYKGRFAVWGNLVRFIFLFSLREIRRVYVAFEFFFVLEFFFGKGMGFKVGG